MAGRGGADRSAGGCNCSNISVMQLFHELKQQFPALPDKLVSDCANTHCHDRTLCTQLLRRAAGEMTQAAYPAQALRRAPDPPASSPPQRPTTLHFAPASHSRPSRHAPPPPLPLPPIAQETIEEQYPVNLSLDLNCSSGHSRNPLRTSVNVTVRTPVGSPLQPAAAAHHQSGATAANLLPRHQQPVSHHQQVQGFQSRLHITVSPSSASGPQTSLLTQPRRPRSYYGPLIPEPPITPTRVARAESLPDVLADLAPEQANTVKRQLERKHRLECELEAERSRLRAMQREVCALEGPAVSQGPGRALILKQEIQTLQSQCVVLAQRVDQYTGDRIPLCETSEEFYQNIYTGQQLHMPSVRRRRREPPPRPPPPRPLGISEATPWTCHLCTFRNHPLLNKCEQCEMPCILRVTAGEDIHIHVTPGHDFIRSWVV
ncbi:TGF-beta-activated kinase 1 and MAP3K7-binding protein 2 isoform X2 [Ctenocephalides felis]|uniref:TGF-beta-activated kinase 1 and MAP3K7-binding protein 2 isoform X2 n=1 Tax=Ctenocephalides felis TaxID=7515 RepID=UPI000E6E21A5|nr:TGF-beta-activated kinase 1 and MAP3K7-binding protein 2 isoform X2 [Ctenocephalides felis]